MAKKCTNTSVGAIRQCDETVTPRFVEPLDSTKRQRQRPRMIERLDGATQRKDQATYGQVNQDAVRH